MSAKSGKWMATPAEHVIPPHVENIIVRSKCRLAAMRAPELFIETHMPPVTGSVESLYNGLTQAARSGALYIAERTGIPPFSTTFWRPDQPLQRTDDSKRIRYRYPTPDGGRTLTFVGFQEPIETIPAGALVRVSLAHWWRPEDDHSGELRCYVQLSGWFLPKPAPPDQPATPRQNTRPPRHCEGRSPKQHLHRTQVQVSHAQKRRIASSRTAGLAMTVRREAAR